MATTTILLGLLAILGGLVIIYSTRKNTFPGYEGNGGWGLPVVVALLAFLVLWIVGKYIGGSSNVLGDSSTAINFGLHYDNSYLTMATWVLVFGLIGVAGVAAWNMARYGKAVM